jgi:hypothetical protein
LSSIKSLPVVLASWVAIVLTGCSTFGPRNLSRPSDDDGVVLENLQSFKDFRASRGNVHSREVAKLPPPSLEITKEVKHEMSCFLKGNGRFLRESLERRDKYYPVMAQIFEDEGVPHELLSLAMIESGYNVHARSNVGAVGMWQFMKSTARLYGLNVGLFEDQRKDPILSTVAAARHLKDLYNIYKDWYLVLAAYNAGPGAVAKAMVRSGTSDFWNIARKGRLTKQTRDFIPRFIAAALIIRNPGEYGLEGSEPNPEIMASLRLNESTDAKNKTKEAVALQEKPSAIRPVSTGTTGWSRSRRSPAGYKETSGTGRSPNPLPQRS